MVAGVGASQLIALLAIPFVARLFAPEHFGVAALYLTVVNILVIPASLRLEQSVVLPKENAEALALIRASALILVIFVLVLWSGLYAIDLISGDYLSSTGLGAFAWFVPLGVLLLAIVNLAKGVATRQKSFGTIARGTVVQAAVVNLLRLPLGWIFLSSVWLLVASLLLAYICQIIVLLRDTKKDFINAFNLQVKRGWLFESVVNYKEFPLYSVPTGLLRAFNDALPLMLLAGLFGPAPAGFYAMSSRLARLPVSLVGEPVRLAFLQRASVKHGSGDAITGDLALLTLLMLLMAIGGYLPLVFYGAEIFSLVLGEQWEVSGEYAAILVPWMVALFIQAPAACVFVIYKRQNILLMVQSLATCSMGGVGFLAWQGMLNDFDTIRLISLIGCVANIFLILVALTFAIRTDKKL